MTSGAIQPELVTLLDEAGVDDDIHKYLIKRGITTTGVMAAMASTIAELDGTLVQPHSRAAFPWKPLQRGSSTHSACLWRGPDCVTSGESSKSRWPLRQFCQRPRPRLRQLQHRPTVQRRSCQWDGGPSRLPSTRKSGQWQGPMIS